MQILPVLDILRGEVVHGVGGQRTDYRRIQSCLTTSCDVIEVANAIRKTLGLEQFYLADLDAINGQNPNLAIYRQLISDGFDLLIDAGIRHLKDAESIIGSGTTQIVVGLETCRSPDDLATIVSLAHNVTFSLDLFLGIPRFELASEGWSNEIHQIVRQAVRANVDAILPLDLSDVGMGSGGSTDNICRFVRTDFPQIRLIAGGGVRSVDDLQRLKTIGADAVLVASALHNGRLTREDLTMFK